MTKYHVLERRRGDEVRSTLVTTCEEGMLYDQLAKDGMIVAEFFVSGPVTADIAKQLAWQYHEVLCAADGVTERLFANTFMATRHPKQ